MQGIQAIETVYKGYRFRSRTEARWAVFFDTIGIKYIYEPEGYVFEDGTHYLPDFYLPNAKMFFEVKGIEPSPEDMRKINKLATYSKKHVAIGYSDMSFQATSFWGDANENIIAEFDTKGESWLIQCHSCGEYQFIGSCGIWSCRGCGYYDGDHGFECYCTGDWPDTSYSWDKPEGKVLDAFITARQARFEHGERPNDLFI